MTDNEIEMMEEGDALDSLIQAFMERYGNPNFIYHDLRYSTEIKHAEFVLEPLYFRGVRCKATYSPNFWRVTLTIPRSGFLSCMKEPYEVSSCQWTLPMAICKAVLKGSSVIRQ